MATNTLQGMNFFVNYLVSHGSSVHLSLLIASHFATAILEVLFLLHIRAALLVLLEIVLLLDVRALRILSFHFGDRRAVCGLSFHFHLVVWNVNFTLILNLLGTVHSLYLNYSNY